MKIARHLLRYQPIQKTPSRNNYPAGFFLAALGVPNLKFDIDLSDLYDKLVKKAIVGTFKEEEFSNTLHDFMIENYNISVQMEDTIMLPSNLPNFVAFGGSFGNDRDNQNIDVLLYFDSKRTRNRPMEIDFICWELYCHEIVQSVAHELIHAAQYFYSKNRDIYIYPEFEPRIGLKEKHRKEMEYIFEPVEMEAFIFNAILDSKVFDIPPEDTKNYVILNRCLKRLEMYYHGDVKYIREIKREISRTKEFWNTVLLNG